MTWHAISWRVLALVAAGLAALVALPFAYEEYVGDSLTGGYTGAEKRAMARSCTGGADTITLAFARRAGHAPGGVMAGPDGCYVDVAVPKSAGPDPMDAIDAAVAGAGWERVGDATWTRADGFTINAREWDPETSADPRFVEYDMLVWGSAHD